jgi:BirA family biotin operon repressor/biotin-[acetyl-CoA-carboxylase] ligase
LAWISPINLTTDAAILTGLRAAGDAGVSGTDLAQRLGVSRATIGAHIETLRQLGYDIEASPHRGYRLVSTPDRLLADDLYSRLGDTRIIGRDIQVFRETTSTNDIVEKLARDRVKEGVVVFAETQTRGRGRLGRKWSSPVGKGLWFSVLLRPGLRPVEVTRLTVASATALVRAIRQSTGLVPKIKWPNDILIQGKKVAGILSEMNAEGDRVRHVVLGIGVNVNFSTTDFPADLRRLATSLKIASGGPVDRAELAAALLRELDHDYARVNPRQFPALADEWEAQCITLGNQVTVQVGGRRVQGRAESLNDDGTLLVRTQHGRLEHITGGDVFLEK